jgi:hypothetical protein
MKRALYDVTDDIAELLDLADDPEIDEQTILDTLEGLAYEFDEKAANIARMIDELEALAEIRSDKAAALRKQAQTDSNRAERLRGYLLGQMQKVGRLKFDVESRGDAFKFSTRNSDRVIVDEIDVNKVPEEFLRRKDPEIAKDALKKALKAGDEGAAKVGHLEKHMSLIIR